MTRSTYRAPGVYVEEIPSARQPIAGVGTNTAAFIGIVPDIIHITVSNDNYDPVAARDAQDGQTKSGEALPTPPLPTPTDGQQSETSSEGGRRKPPKSDSSPAPVSAEDKGFAGPAVGLDTLERDKWMQPPVKPKAPGEDASKPPEREKAPAEHPYYLQPFRIKADYLDTKFCTSFTEYTDLFGSFSAFVPGVKDQPMYPGHHALTHAVYGFFKNGGTRCFVARVRGPEELTMEKVLKNFESIDEVALIAAPGFPQGDNVWNSLMEYSEDDNHENVFAILDTSEDQDPNNFDANKIAKPRASKNAAFYFPQIEVVDPAKQLQDVDLALNIEAKYRGRTFVSPSGHMAGVYARTDEERGVHKAPANCVVRGAIDVKYYVSKPKQEILNPWGVNVIKTINGAVTVWGARTIGGDRNGEWKYINVRRFFLFLQESIDEGTQWVVFEPNDYALWGKIRLNVTAFLTNVWRSGALFGLTPEEAFYVKCDAELNPPEVRDLGQVITEIGVAIVRPAEFVIFRISQSTGQEKG